MYIMCVRAVVSRQYSHFLCVLLHPFLCRLSLCLCLSLSVSVSVSAVSYLLSVLLAFSPFFILSLPLFLFISPFPFLSFYNPFLPPSLLSSPSFPSLPRLSIYLFNKISVLLNKDNFQFMYGIINTGILAL